MGKDKRLTLINTPDPLEEASNFWRVCPRRLEYLPTTPCLKGKPIITGKSKRVQDEPSCAWWINSEEHNYCFWRYVHDKSSPEGVMPELVQSELAQLFGWSNTKTHFVLKEAMEELTNALVVHGAVQMISDLDEDVVEDLDLGFDILIDDQDEPFE